MKGYKAKHSIRIPSAKKQQVAQPVASPPTARKPKEVKKKENVKKEEILSNHERIIAQRAEKQNLTIEQYKKQYSQESADK